MQRAIHFLFTTIVGIIVVMAGVLAGAFSRMGGMIAFVAFPLLLALVTTAALLDGDPQGIAEFIGGCMPVVMACLCLYAGGRMIARLCERFTGQQY